MAKPTTTRRRRLQDTTAIVDGEAMQVEHITNQPVDMPAETQEQIIEGARNAIAEIEQHTASIENAKQDLSHWVMLRDDLLRSNSDAPDKLYKIAWSKGKDRKLMTDDEKLADAQRTSYQQALIISILGEMPKQNAKGKDADVEIARAKYADDRSAIMSAFDLTRQLATLGVWHQHFDHTLSAFVIPASAFLCENTREETFVMKTPPATIPLLLPSAARKAGYMQSHLIAWEDNKKTLSDLMQASLSRIKVLADDRISPKKPVEPATRAPGGETNQQAAAGSSAAQNALVIQPAGETVITPEERDAAPDKVTPEQLKRYLDLFNDHVLAICRLFAVNVVQASSIRDLPPAMRNNVTDMMMGLNRLYTNADLPPIVDYNKLAMDALTKQAKAA